MRIMRKFYQSGFTRDSVSGMYVYEAAHHKHSTKYVLKLCIYVKSIHDALTFKLHPARP
jgi:hypothetical protein